MKLGQLELVAGKPVVAVSFTDADGVRDIDQARAAGVGIAELRIDQFARADPPYVVAQARRLNGLPQLATIRLAEEGGGWHAPEAEREALFKALLPIVDGIDVELRAAEAQADVIHLAQAMGKPVVLSHHDFVRTPSYSELTQVALRAVRAGADIVKIATQVVSDDDIGVLSQLLAEGPVRSIVLIGMGEHGLPTRLLFPSKGSLFTFAANGDRASAPGQLPYDRMLKLLANLPSGT